jgi:hypothetical protein
MTAYQKMRGKQMTLRKNTFASPALEVSDCNSKMPCKFRIEWVASYPWIARGLNQSTARCVVCDKMIDISTMGSSALRSHMKGQKHQKLVNLKKQSQCLNITRDQSVPSTSAVVSSVPSPVPVSGLAGFADIKQLRTAEIWYALHLVSNAQSFKSSSDVSFIMRQMFPDSIVATQFTFGETKSMYTVVFGLAPFFKSLLEKKIKGKPYVLMFDESPNKKMQSKQLDILIRFWDGDNVRSRYYDSTFLGHGTAQDLMEHLSPAIQNLGVSNLVQLSMDGPNVNWALWEKVQRSLHDEAGRNLVNIGSCGLHILHNSFRAGM